MTSAVLVITGSIVFAAVVLKIVLRALIVILKTASR